MMVLQTLLVLSATLILCSGARLPRQSYDKVRRLPGLDTCGIAAVKVLPTKVVGGHPAELGEFPWIAALGYTTRGSRGISWSCAGSLITDQHVLTAAHCVHPDSITTRRSVAAIRLGEHNLNEAVRDGAQPLDIPVERVIMHKQYNGVEKTNDIAIIKMKTKVTFTDFIKPICLAPPEFETKDFKGFSPAIVGWGRTHANKPRDDTRLLKAEVKIQSTDECRRNVTSAPNLGAAIIDTRVVCASSPGIDTCQGDSGGPLMLQRKIEPSPEHNWFLMGVVSYGYSCAKEGYPGVYTRVSPFMSWIVDNLDI